MKLNMQTLMLLIMGLGSIITKRVAIIGCGVGGSSAAYFLQGYNVTIFEKDSSCGGRLDNIKVSNKHSKNIELGGTMFVDENKYLKYFIELTGKNYSRCDQNDNTIGIFDTHGETNTIIFKTSSSDFITLGKLIYNYGLSPLKLKTLAEEHLLKFQEIYHFQEQGKVFQNYSEFLQIIGFKNDSSQSISDYLVSKGISENYIDDFVAGIIASIYNQDYQQVHSIAGMVSIIATVQKTYQINGGNKHVFQSLINDVLDVDVRYNVEVKEIKQIPNNKYNIVSRTNSTEFQDQFDVVILATLINSGQSIKLPKGAQDRLKIYNETKHQVTHIYVVGGKLNNSFFGLDSDEQIPTMLLSKNVNNTIFTDFQSVCSQCYNQSQSIYKIQSQKQLSSEQLSKVFTYYDVIKHKIWAPAYPSLKQSNYMPQFELSENLYYVNSMEYLVSCMETEIISARNIANRIIQLNNTDKILHQNQSNSNQSYQNQTDL